MSLNLEKQDLLKVLTENATPQELSWIHGYIAGLLSIKENNTNQIENESSIPEIQIIFITETGNSKTIATDISVQLKALKIKASVKSANQTNYAQLSNGGYVLIIVSTHGEGEIPAAGKKIMDYLQKEKPNLSKLNYSIIALGDSSYSLFCEAGKIIDRKLKKLEAKPFLDLQMSDVDISEVKDNWLNEFKKIALKTGTTTAKNSTVKPVKSNKANNEGVVLENQLLNDIGSNKAVYHLAIQSDAAYEPGDSLRYVPSNSKELATKIADTLKLDLKDKIEYKNNSITIEELLSQYLEIERIKQNNIEKYIAIAGVTIEKTNELVDEDFSFLLKKYSPKNKISPRNLIDILNPIEARFYSIASSPSAHNGEIHLTVSDHQFIKKENKISGKASHLLKELKEKETINFSIHKNSLFRLPQENKDVIMIGPGTGIAPFRSFLFERDSQSASGKNWLFFGDQHFQSDFLYQSELQDLFSSGVLTKLNTAFSRDQKEKIYVQTRMKENGKELIEWIENGSYIYVCGTKDPMSKDVENTLIELLQTHKKISQKEAIKFLEDLKEDGRYNQDVY